ncbi:MAG TPA: PPOX class F420-dependent oxidoreductase [Acidimicrobiia bacterium]|nr:PPOX class F420-dependent oxidoreductase [Acidimicrobiia bacterium]
MAANTTDLRTPAQPLERFADDRQILLTTYRRDGTPVGTPVHVVVDGDHAYVRTFEPSGKLKRIRRNPDVEVAPSTLRGRPTGPATPATARVLEGDEAEHAARLLAAKYPVLHGRLIPWYHRRKRLVTTELELTAR